MSGVDLVAAVEAVLPAWLAGFLRHRAASAVAGRRARWAALMAASVPGFVASDELFVRHSLLVAVARAVARAIGGSVDTTELAGVLDWTEDVDAGLSCGVQTIVAARDWTLQSIDGDVLGPLVAALISAEQRKGAGEHYTPDWLAQRVLARSMVGGDSVMDPACGSGTFVFHAVRRALAEPGVTVADVLRRVRGMDVHPVAVVLARVNYLLAIGGGRWDVPIRQGDAMAAEGEVVDLLTGNPPWLAYRFMSAEMQVFFKRGCEEFGLWAGGTVSTHQDLCGLFMVRVIDRLLRMGGRFGFVMPGAVLDRAQFAGLRGGWYGERVGVEFLAGWDLRRMRPHVFPVGAAVVIGERTAGAGAGLRTSEVWGRDGACVRAVAVKEGERSPYHARFRQGATLVPRVFVLVERAGAEVRSVRSAYEKRPWRELSGLRGAVEAEFLWPVVLGEHVVPYRSLAPALGVVPWGAAGWVEAGDETPGLAAWWRAGEARWIEHRASERLTLRGQLNYQQKLASQFPAAPLRVVYTKSGMHLAAAKLRDLRAIVDHTLYWAAVGCDDEADYLCALLNAAGVTRRVRPWMAYGKDERHIDKNVWRLAIPAFDAANEVHRALSDAGRRAGAEIASLSVTGRCIAMRREIRGYLADSATGREIEGLVAELLGG